MNKAITATQNWVKNVVIKYNFCPFARKEVESDAVRYLCAPVYDKDATMEAALALIDECRYLQATPDVETSLLIFSEQFRDFEDFLDVITLADTLLDTYHLRGDFQIAHFHPDYQFDGVAPDDVTNYTNRAPYPVLHVLREASMAATLTSVDNPDAIYEHNMALTERKGKAFWQALLNACKNRD